MVAVFFVMLILILTPCLNNHYHITNSRIVINNYSKVVLYIINYSKVVLYIINYSKVVFYIIINTKIIPPKSRSNQTINKIIKINKK